MRLLKFLLILPLIIYGGVKGYIWYKVKDLADTTIAQMTPFAEISYGSIFSSFKGTAGIENLVIRPKMTTDEFTIQKMGFSAGNLLELLTMSKQLQQKKLPTHIGLEMEKFKIDLNSELFSMLAQMQKQTSQQSNPTVIERGDAIACGSIEDFGIKELTDMGYNQMVLDIEMNIDYQENLKRMAIATQVKDRDFYSAKFQTSFRFDIPEIVAAGRSYQPVISSLSLDYKDNGYYELRNKYCAKQRGSNIEDYINANITGLSQGIGAKFPNEVVENYRQFMTKGGSLRLSLKPNEETNLRGLKFYKPKEVMSLLGVEIAINGVKLDQSKIEWGDINKGGPVNVDTAQIQKSKATPPKAETIAETPVESEEVEPQFRTVQKSNLASHVGKRIQVVTSSGKQRDGVLESVGNERIRIQVRLGSGEYSFPIKLEEIKQAQVYM